MNVQIIPLSQIIPYEKNPRKNKSAIPYVKKSIKDFGFRVPILLDSNNVIVAGHTRYYASKELQLKEVPCIYIENLSEDQIKAFRLVDNKTSEYSEWDMDLLGNELKVLPEFDLGSFGFDLQLNHLDIDSPIDSSLDDVVEELPENPITKIGDIYQLGSHRLMCGNSSNPKDLQKLMNHEKCNLLLTDPPYNVSYIGKRTKRDAIMNDALTRDGYRIFLKDIFQNIYDYMSPGSVFYIFYSILEGSSLFPLLESVNFHISNVIIWYKNHFVLSRGDYHNQYEPIVYGWFGSGNHYFIDDRTQSNVWEYQKPSVSDLHPTMKPVELLLRILHNSSRENDLVLDTFGGSGSTLIACENSHRRCYMMEKSPAYCDIIIKRWESMTGQKAVLL